MTDRSPEDTFREALDALVVEALDNGCEPDDLNRICDDVIDEHDPVILDVSNLQPKPKKP